MALGMRLLIVTVLVAVFAVTWSEAKPLSNDDSSSLSNRLWSWATGSNGEVSVRQERQTSTLQAQKIQLIADIRALLVTIRGQLARCSPSG